MLLSSFESIAPGIKTTLLGESLAKITAGVPYSLSSVAIAKLASISF